MKSRPRPRVFEHISDPRRVLPRCPARAAAAAAAEDEKRTDCGGVEAIAKRTTPKRGLQSVGPKTHSVMAMMALSGSEKLVLVCLRTQPFFIQSPLLLQTLTTWSFYPDTGPFASTLSIQSRVVLLSSCPARPCPALPCPALWS
jgi:hypothetical protein